MTRLRHFLGYALVALCGLASELLHELIHIGGWLMDHEDFARAKCETCQERRP